MAKLWRALWAVSHAVRMRPGISPSSFDKLRMRGKTLRGSRRPDDRPLHVLPAFATGLSAVIGDLAVAPDANEITAAMVLLKGLPLILSEAEGRWSDDHRRRDFRASREICRHIRDANGHDLFAVKGNQPELESNIKVAFGDLSPFNTSDISDVSCL
ncbi:MAG: hypothetical protein ACRECP_02905 [Methylocella sp.]